MHAILIQRRGDQYQAASARDGAWTGQGVTLEAAIGALIIRAHEHFGLDLTYVRDPIQGPVRVTLLAVPRDFPQRIEIIRRIREAAGLGLKEAKELVDRAPHSQLVLDSEIQAQRFINAVAEQGGTAVLTAP